jgi:PAS domain S-box-containing protein
MEKPSYEELDRKVGELEKRLTIVEKEREKAFRNHGERVKELNCLYGLSKLVERSNVTLEEIFRETVNLIPPSWQYPDITCGRIIAAGKEFKTGNFEITGWKQSGDINVQGKVVGNIEVYYREEMPELDEGPFLHEERFLINTISERLGRVIERRQAEEALEHELAVKAALSELYEPLISASSTIQDITRLILEKALHLTASEHGYVSAIDPDTRDNVGYTLTEMLKDRCRVSRENKRIAFPIGKDGFYRALWGYALNTGEPFFTNTPMKHPASTGLPRGHIPLTRFLSFPVKAGEELMGQIALANKTYDYTDRDLETIRGLAKYYALAIQRMRTEEELQKAHDELEIRVQVRTAEIAAANQKLSREINERKKTEMELQESESQYKRLVEGIPGMLYLFSDKRGGIFYSSSVETVLGYPISNLYQNPELWSLSIHPDDREKVKEAVKNFPGGEDFDLEYRIKDASGNWHWFHDRSIGRRTGEGEIILEGLALDITGKKKAEQEQEKLLDQLREAQKIEAIGTLAGGIAHDFNNILAAIIGYTELTMDEIPGENTAFANMKEVLRAGNRAKNLIKQILAFSRQGTRERKPLRIDIVIKEALKLLRATIPTTIQIRENIAPDPGTILADPTQIHQVMMNLGTNAYHAMRDDGGILGVTLKPVETAAGDVIQGIEMLPGKYIELEISDTGHGMNRAVLARIFDPYFTTKKKGEGTGLGLAVVHGIVKSHNGYITASSKPGTGTRFRIYLPCIDSYEDKTEIITAEPIPGGREHILFVDDEEPLVHMSRETLEKLGYRVTARTSSREALQAFQKQPGIFDLVITDMTMPQMTGVQLARKLVEIKPGIPIILITGFSEAIDENKARKLGFREYVMKPILTRELAKTIRKVLDPKARD